MVSDTGASKMSDSETEAILSVNRDERGDEEDNDEDEEVKLPYCSPAHICNRGLALLLMCILGF
ncbi:hypothetical protein B566_EDAN000841, partial [Ephemera danica]